MSEDTKQDGAADAGKTEDKAPKAPGIGDVAKQLIREGKTNEEVLAALKEKFPEGKTAMASVNWYRNKLRTDGEEVPTARSLKAGEKEALKAEKKAKYEAEKAEKAKAAAEAKAIKDAEKAKEKAAAKEKADAEKAVKAQEKAAAKAKADAEKAAAKEKAEADKKAKADKAAADKKAKAEAEAAGKAGAPTDADKKAGANGGNADFLK